MDPKDGGGDEEEEEEFGFSRNYFLAREIGGGSGKKSGRKLSDIDLADEQVLFNHPKTPFILLLSFKF